MIAFKNTPVEDKQMLKMVSSPFGMRKHPISGEMKLHTGTDFRYPTGTMVYSVASGVVKASHTTSGAGNYITIQHNGFYTIYEHLQMRYVKDGEPVKAGQKIGLVGSTGDSTGPHLHFGVCTRYNLQAFSKSNWEDPVPYIQDLLEEDMTEQQVKDIVNKCLDERANLKESAVFAEDLKWAKTTGILAGDNKGNLLPQKFATRQEVIAFIHRLYKLIKGEK